MDRSDNRKVARLLIDTNVIMDVMLEREPFFEASKRILDICNTEGFKGYIAFHCLPTLWYLTRKAAPDNMRRAFLRNILSFLDVAGADKAAILAAVNNDAFPDFEDCLQDECAFSVDADYIITRNKKDFAAAKVQAVYPEEFVVA